MADTKAFETVALKESLEGADGTPERGEHERKSTADTSESCSPRTGWKEAIKKVVGRGWEDPFPDFDMEETPTERGTRFRYNVSTSSWVTDPVLIKLESKEFGRGAQRICYRLKKRPSSYEKGNWKHSSCWIAKQYIHDVPDDVLRNDVTMQEIAKHYGEMFNERDPPKKVDFISTFFLELPDRDGANKFCVERYIPGEYVKYNSNCGFVDQDHVRNTPSAFSHFSFEASNRQAIVVDIQGVGDIYTDPQIHEHTGKLYGEGNLGRRGFALFFYSHRCNVICKTLNFKMFDVYHPEKPVNMVALGAATMTRGIAHRAVRKMKTYTPTLDKELGTIPPNFEDLVPEKIVDCQEIGEIHMTLSESHEDGSLPGSDPNPDAALFHLLKAANCGVVRSLLMLAKIYRGVTGVIEGLEPMENTPGVAFGFALLAAERGMRSAMLDVARAFMEGEGVTKNVKEAVHWFTEVQEFEKLDAETGEGTGLDPMERCEITASLARLAEEGGDGFDQDYEKAGDLYAEAATLATTARQGRLATKYYAKSEECYESNFKSGTFSY